MDQKIAALFEKIKAKNLFWSYAKDISLEDINMDLLVETVLKYGDVDDISLVFECFYPSYVREVWVKRILFDERFKKLNFYLGKIFFNLDPEQVKRERKENDRANKLGMLAAQDSESSE